MLANVLICRNVPKSYTYLIPENNENYSVGAHVEIPFGKSLAVGVILDIHDGPRNSKLKEVGQLLTKKPILSTELLDFIEWFKNYYQLSPHKAYQAIVGTMKFRDLKDEDDIDPPIEEAFKPNKEQQEVMDNIMAKNDHSYLLHGVTSSGKTEVYMQIAKQIIKQNKTVLMLLPEIGLTPQMRRHFKARFGANVAVIHSGLTPKQREVEWNKIYQDQVSIVIGPRSAIFTPLKNIGLIILDEEHDGSYKQENTPRYHTHTVAEYRRKYNKCRLIYGTATPSLELFYDAYKNKTVTLLQMKHRVNKNPLPEVTIIDMKDPHSRGEHPILSEPLIQGIQDNIKHKNKTLLLLNRRGYSPYIVCQSCQTIHNCPDCKLSFTYHKDGYFRCHRCDQTEPLTHICRKCKKNHLNFGGIGTQKVETELRKLFPDIQLYRLDRDTATTAKKLEAVLEGFQKDGDLLLGTQMIAKGHHFEDVTLVGVLGIDSVLGIPDFRSCERTFQLLSQVSGRAGRGKKTGRVILQSSDPEHYVIDHAITQDYDAFYSEEIAFRESLRYPPFSDMVHLIMSSTEQKKIKPYAEKVQTHLQTHWESEHNPDTQWLQVMGPKPAPIEKIRDHYRWHILLKCDHSSMELVKTIIQKIPKAPKDIRFIVDIDPRSIL